MESIPTIRKRDPRHVQGFTPYKLWLMGCWARGGGHGKSIDLERDLPTNYDKQYKSVILEQAAVLKRRGLINIWPTAGGRKAVAAVISEEAIKAGLPIVDTDAKSVGEDPLEGTIREIITGKRSERKSPLSREELRKFARMHKQAERSSRVKIVAAPPSLIIDPEVLLRTLAEFANSQLLFGRLLCESFSISFLKVPVVTGRQMSNRKYGYGRTRLS